MNKPDDVCRLMASFWYYRRRDLSAIVSGMGRPVRLMVDSGAFSAHEQRTHSGGVGLDDYAAWLADHWPLITTAINLDVIGNPAASARNQLALEERGLAVTPVWHSGSPYSELEALCRDYRYVAVGGPTVVETRRAMLLGMSAKAALIAREHGTVLHGLGRSGSDDLNAVPWYSADASSWMLQVFNGSVLLYEPGRLRSVKFAGAVRQPSALRKHGINPALMSHGSYALKRDRTDGLMFRRERHEALRGAVISYKRMEAWLQARHKVPPPQGVPENGTCLYFVIMNRFYEAAVADGVRWLAEGGG